jgi:hypothetical protein
VTLGELEYAMTGQPAAVTWTTTTPCPAAGSASTPGISGSGTCVYVAPEEVTTVAVRDDALTEVR